MYSLLVIKVNELECFLNFKIKEYTLLLFNYSFFMDARVILKYLMNEYIEVHINKIFKNLPKGKLTILLIMNMMGSIL